MERKQLKEKAIKLRKQGKTYSEIQRILKTVIPKSTLSFWCKDIKLPKEYEDRIRKIVSDNAQRGREIALIVNKTKREKFLNGLEKRNLYLLKKLNKDIFKMLLAMLYICEGGKWRFHRGLLFGNSDPEMIKFYIKLLKICYPETINNNILRCRILYRADQNIEKLQEFWSKTLKIPLRNFYKTKPDSRTIGKKTKKKNYKGVCVITSRGTEIQIELETIAKILFTKT